MVATGLILAFLFLAFSDFCLSQQMLLLWKKIKRKKNQPLRQPAKNDAIKAEVDLSNGTFYHIRYCHKSPQDNEDVLIKLNHNSA